MSAEVVFESRGKTVEFLDANIVVKQIAAIISRRCTLLE